MSFCSGKCDLLDHISGLGGWYDKNGNPVKFGQEGVGCYYSDIMQDFEEFKKRTKGIIHQHVKVKVDEWNQDYVKSHCSGFDFTKHVKYVDDKRYKDGRREIYYYIYTYYGKEYTLKQLNQHGVYITKDIHFKTILDLLPYFPYVVACVTCSHEQENIYLANRSEVEDNFRQHHWDSNEHMCDYYRHELSELAKNIVLIYMSDYKERTIEQDFKVEKEDDKYIVHLEKPVDYNFEIELITNGESIWSSPKQIDDYTLDVSNTYFDIENRDNIKIKYVYKGENKVWLK